jgi:hypothetical protein
MTFQASVVFEFSAHDIGDAGKRLDELLEEARSANSRPGRSSSRRRAAHR